MLEVVEHNQWLAGDNQLVVDHKPWTDHILEPADHNRSMMPDPIVPAASAAVYLQVTPISNSHSTPFLHPDRP